MLQGSIDIGFLSYALAALSYGAFFVHYAWQQRSATAVRSPVSWALTAALLAGALWACLGLLVTYGHTAPGVEEFWLPLADASRYGLWFAFILLLLPRPQLPAWRPLRWMVVALALALCASLLVILLNSSRALPSIALQRPAAFAALAQALLGMMLVEQLLRNVPADARWGAKPVCLALGSIFIFDVYLYSQAALFRQFDGDALAIRPAVHSFAVPLLFLASKRHRDWLAKLHVSRVAIFHSATLLIAGAYLLLVSGVGYYVRYTGGDWGRALQIALVVVALLALTMVLLSGAMRAKLRVYISKHFFRYRYDYRDEWLRFTAMLSSQSSPQELGNSVIKGLANLVESPSGALWLRYGQQGEYRQSAVLNMPAAAQSESADAPFIRFLQTKNWIVDLDELRRFPDRYPDCALPAWMLSAERCWLLVPLGVGAEMIGFVVLGPARTRLDLNWEVRDLLRTASSQACSYLAQMLSTEALLEARKFDAFNRMSAFVVHDLKNIVTQLSLMMANARRLRDNPEFQEDMLATVENSLAKMRQLMLQLREGERPQGGGSGAVDLARIVRRLAEAAQSKGRALSLQINASASTRGHEDRVERVIGHVVQNALDATPVDGRVWLHLDAAGSYARVEVGDTGCGMSEEFVRTRLFKPFQSTKVNGMGIGAYESFQYLNELGGRIDVDSELNRGTKVMILLPLLHVSASSDLDMLGVN
jgi:putative PEP-CTERM system histidine kinase